MANFTLHHTTRTYPTLAFEAMKDAILGKSYNLSLVFVGATRAQALNQEHRGKSYTPNVLSFPLTDTDGEITITPTVARKEAPDYNLSYEGYVGFLFIHGCLHLKGLDHGDTMERAEKKYLKQFKLV